MISFTVPIRAPSTANLREHWGDRARRAKKQKRDVRLLCPRWEAGPLLVVRLIRVGPTLLDRDNAIAALKAVQDGVASWLRIDDGSPLVKWEYGQEIGEPGIRVEVSE